MKKLCLTLYLMMKEYFPAKIGITQNVHSCQFYSVFYEIFLTSETRQEKEIKVIHIGKEETKLFIHR